MTTRTPHVGLVRTNNGPHGRKKPPERSAVSFLKKKKRSAVSFVPAPSPQAQGRSLPTSCPCRAPILPRPWSRPVARAPPPASPQDWPPTGPSRAELGTGDAARRWGHAEGMERGQAAASPSKSSQVVDETRICIITLTTTSLVFNFTALARHYIYILYKKCSIFMSACS